MLNKLLVYLVPFLLPFVIYGIYLVLARKGKVADIARGPWLVLIAAGFVLLLITIGFLALTGGGGTDDEYIPPRVEDGVLKPGEFRDRE